MLLPLVSTATCTRRRKIIADSSLPPLLLLLLLLVRLTPAAAFSILGSSSSSILGSSSSSSILGSSSSSSSSSINPSYPIPSTTPLIDRVPTFRLYQGGVCQTQVPGRGDAAECRARLHEAITRLTKRTPTSSIDHNAKEKEKGGDSSSVSTRTRGRTVAAILEIDSLSALEGLLAEQLQQQEKPSHGIDEVLLVEFYGQSCKQCIALAPLFESLPYVYPNQRLRFGRADVTKFPTLVVPPPSPQRFQGLDRSQNIEERLDGCPTCGGAGFVACVECGGKGHFVRSVNGHTVADVCMTCMGQKKVPCPQCGGKCYLC